ncbi:alpha/beta hydrolase family protein [Kutzneria sp. CA-103260]|uniref:alpha/beta hydrolase family protein n=1 Tax=Kutzneria sp. CA-103260 TaxID=2802641 RepID=UPI001BA9CB84|nr:alpha/beta fold hydrolase [Kutzneria sp. CA-103260]QUQ69218.1 alpha/beta fold hydrolase [Kutzneria sp. CA-103260]
MPSQGVRGNRPLRFALVTIPVLLVIAVLALLGIGWYYSDQLLDPAQARPGYPDVSLGPTTVGGVSSIALRKAADTTNAGEWAVLWSGGYVQVGEVLSDRDGTTVRKLLKGQAPPAGTPVRFSPQMWPGDPKSALGLDFQHVNVPTELGPMPAWLTPGTTNTWVIAIHGRGGTPEETLRAIPPLHQLGLSVLSITYRNDSGAPPSPDGFFHLGDSEWQDVESAMKYATAHGARHTVLYGWSMGGAIAEQLLARSPLASQVDAVVLDAPAVSWGKTLVLQAQNRGLPLTGLLTWDAELVSGWRAGIDFGRMELIDSPPAHRPPTLLFHGSADGTVPVQASRDLAAAAGRLDWPLTYVEVPNAEHTAAWNVDPTGYEGHLRDFLGSRPDLTR